MPAKRTKEQQAAYMREYRARKAAEKLTTQQKVDLEAAERWGSVPDIPPSVPVFHAQTHTGTAPQKPSFLAAPDEDCVCGHDRHAYHLTGPCTAYIRPKTKCPCPGFMADLGFE